jgi:hypothetical protein
MKRRRFGVRRMDWAIRIYNGLFPERLVRRLGILGPMSDVTRLLDAAAAADHRAAAELFPIVYDELRRVAAARLDREKPGHTLDATALVHEAYLRLIGDRAYTGRGHFLAVAAEAMLASSRISPVLRAISRF